MIIPDDAPKYTIISDSAPGAWETVIQSACRVRNIPPIVSTSDIDDFGFTDPTIAKMVQDLKGARKCKDYAWQEFAIIPTIAV
jgi:hypothetical protein